MSNVNKIYAIEKFVKDIEASSEFYRGTLGYRKIAVSDCFHDDGSSYLLELGDSLLILTEGKSKDSTISQHIEKYGEGIQNIILDVSNVNECFQNSVKEGMEPVQAPSMQSGAGSEVEIATVKTFNYVNHTFVHFLKGELLPGFTPVEDDLHLLQENILGVDHLAICHEAETIEKFVNFYTKALGFIDNRREDIHSDISGMKTVVVESPNGNIKFPMVEPCSEKSPLMEFLNHNEGSGIHHIAYRTSNILETVDEACNKGLEFHETPASYYEHIKKQGIQNAELIDELANRSILIDEEQQGYLMQIFTLPIVDRPTLFLEFIQRNNTQGFGSGNIKALYDSLERDAS